jgi:hypothetical protein
VHFPDLSIVAGSRAVNDSGSNPLAGIMGEAGAIFQGSEIFIMRSAAQGLTEAQGVIAKMSARPAKQQMNP